MTRRFTYGTGLFPLAAVVALTLTVGAARSALAADKGESGADVFDPVKVWPVLITVSAEEFAAIQPRGGFGFGPPPKEPTKAADPKREIHKSQFGSDLAWGTGSIVVGDETFEKVGIRYKGNGTVMDTARSLKKSFKIDLDRAGGSGRFGGSKTINLHCGVTDPSKCRETLAYEVYRAAGVPASRTALAEVRLTVPGRYDKELLGLYTIVEEVDKAFLKDRFGDDKGLLMKPERLREFEDLGDDWDKYKKLYSPKRDATADEAKRLIAFSRLVHRADDETFRKEVGSYLDVDGYLRYLAATAFLSNVDSFFVLGHNYDLYLNPKTNKLHFVPWDLDRAFANFNIMGSSAQQMDLSLTHPYAGTHRLTERLLAVPEVAAQYQKFLKDFAGTAFDLERLLKRVAAVEEAVKEPLGRDGKAAAARRDGVGGFGPPGGFGAPPAIKEFVEKRTASVAAQLAGTSKGYVPTGRFGGPPPQDRK